MPPRLHLVRHGEVANPGHVVYASLPGFGLSERGRRQAEAAALRLAGFPVTAIRSSPLTRAVETASIIGAVIGVAVDVDDRLTEWGLAERWAGVRWEDLRRVFPGELEAYLDHPDDLPFAPEPLAALARRVVSAVEEALAGSDGDVVVVSHQDPIQAARLALTGRPLSELWDDKPLHGAVVSIVGGTETGSWAPAEQPEVGTPPTLADLDSAAEAVEELPVGGESELG